MTTYLETYYKQKRLTCLKVVLFYLKYLIFTSEWKLEIELFATVTFILQQLLCLTFHVRLETPLSN